MIFCRVIFVEAYWKPEHDQPGEISVWISFQVLLLSDFMIESEKEEANNFHLESGE